MQSDISGGGKSHLRSFRANMVQIFSLFMHHRDHRIMSNARKENSERREEKKREKFAKN